MESDYDSYEDLEAKVWLLEGVNQKLTAENAVLRGLLRKIPSGLRAANHWMRGNNGAPPDIRIYKADDVLRKVYDELEQALTNTNERSEKMLKVVEAAVAFVNNRGFYDTALVLEQAVREYQEKQNGN